MPSIRFSTPAEEAAFEAQLVSMGAKVTKASPIEAPQSSPKLSKGKGKPKPQPVSLNVSAKGQALWMPHWHPVLLNKLLGHWAAAAKRKKGDKAAIGLAWALAGGRPATSPRRLDLQVILKKGQRAGDRDAYWKSVKDALVHCGAMVEDNRQWCKDGQVTFSRALEDVWGTLILLTDVDK